MQQQGAVEMQRALNSCAMEVQHALKSWPSSAVQCGIGSTGTGASIAASSLPHTVKAACAAFWR